MIARKGVWLEIKKANKPTIYTFRYPGENNRTLGVSVILGPGSSRIWEYGVINSPEKDEIRDEVTDTELLKELNKAIHPILKKRMLDKL